MGVGVAVVDTGLDFTHSDLGLAPEVQGVNAFNASAAPARTFMPTVRPHPASSALATTVSTSSASRQTSRSIVSPCSSPIPWKAPLAAMKT